MSQIKSFIRFNKIALPVTFMPWAFYFFMKDEWVLAFLISIPCSLMLSSFVDSLVFLDDLKDKNDKNSDNTNSNNN